VTARRDLGDFGERVAVHRLEAQGMRIISRNVRVGRIEADIIAEDGSDIVFAEVRTRRGEPGLAAESLDPRKLRRMWQLAVTYCDQKGIDPARIRIDVIAVDLEAGGKARQVEHFRGIEIPGPADD
jgi:putative endonuclease